MSNTIRLAAFVALAVILEVAIPGSAGAQLGGNWQQPGVQAVKPNGYGLGVNQDQYGRPHQYRKNDGTPVDPIFHDGVKRDAYGPGVHMDQFGRPVHDGKASGSEFGLD